MGHAADPNDDAARHARMLAGARYHAAHPTGSAAAALAALGLQPGQRVFDAGCGPGPHLGFLVEAVAPGGNVVGLDLEADRLAVAADLWPDHVASGALRLEQGDVRRPPFGPEFDLVWMSMVLHHVPEPGAALRDLVRVIKPGGRLAILDGDGGAFPCLPWPPDLEERVRAAECRGAAENYGGRLDYHFEPYLGRALPRLLHEAGLTDVEIRVVADLDRAPLDAHREAALRDWLRGWVDGRLQPYLAPVDRDRVLALVDPEDPAYLLTDPDFFVSRTWFLATGRVPE
jgi:SAM-dependent methyltransferase